MNAAESSKSQSFPIRRKIREAEEALCQGSDKLHDIRVHFDMVWGDNHCCDLDVALTYALRRIQEAQTELDDLLRLRRLGLNFKRGRR